MKCPQCGTEYDGPVKQCLTCGWEDSIDAQNPNAKVNLKWLIVHSILWGLFVAALMIWSLLSYIGSYAAIVFFLVYTIKSIRQLIKAKVPGDHRRKKWFAIVLMTFCNLYLVGQLVYRLDAPELKDDYSINDLRSANPKYNDSYMLLKEMVDYNNYDPNNVIGLSQRDRDKLSEIFDTISGVMVESPFDNHTIREKVLNNKEFIRTAWNKSQQYTSVIETLSHYPEIADLDEPNWKNISVANGIFELRELYLCSICLDTSEGNYEAAIDKLLLFDSLAKKLAVNARDYITKVICWKIMNQNIYAFVFLLNDPDFTREKISSLSEHFVPLTAEHLSMRNPTLNNYLVFKNGMDEDFWEDSPRLGFFAKHTPVFKTNSLLRVMRNDTIFLLLKYNEALEALEDEKQIVSVWPRLYPDFGSVPAFPDRTVSETYRKYNPLGTMLLDVMLPAYGRIFERKNSILIQDDLFQWVLARRLGEEGLLKARAYSDEYNVDVEKGWVFSVGPDRAAYTDDDIKLRINPAVLGLK